MEERRAALIGINVSRRNSISGHEKRGDNRKRGGGMASVACFPRPSATSDEPSFLRDEMESPGIVYCNDVQLLSSGEIKQALMGLT